MGFRPSDEQRELQLGVRDFCRSRLGREQIRALEGHGFDRDLWRELAEMGVLRLRLAEASGGMGLGVAEAVLVFEELGRALAPGPLVWTELAAELVPGAAEGDVVVGGIDLRSAADGLLFIEHLEALDALLLLRSDGVHRVEPRAITAERVAAPLDPLTPIHHARALPPGERIAPAAVADRLRLVGAAITAAEMLGVAEATHDLAVAYAKEREQFGRPIGSFQAIKHMLADSFVRKEIARASTYAAAATLDHPEVGEVSQAVAGAKINAGDAAMKNARTCIQVHGGMGYTWEVAAHYYLKRAWVLEHRFGTAPEHADAIGAGVLSVGEAARARATKPL
jgi:alkylation response protein AidB-like acyl-CoA dehydrogenase